MVPPTIVPVPTPTRPVELIEKPLVAVPKYPAVARMSPVIVAPVAVNKPLASMMALPPMFIVEAVMVAPVTEPENTAAPVDALIEKVAVPPLLKPARPAELRTTRAPLVADAPE